MKFGRFGPIESIAVTMSALGAIAAVPQTTNPVVLVAYAIGVVLSVPVLVVLFRVTYALATFVKTLKDSTTQIKELGSEFKQHRHDMRDLLQASDARHIRIESWILSRDPNAPVGPD